MRRCDILTEFRVCCSSVRMKQLQFLSSNNRGPEVFDRKKTPPFIFHQNDNDHHHHWDETLRTVEFACESIRFYISTYREQFTLRRNQQGDDFSLTKFRWQLYWRAPCHNHGFWIITKLEQVLCDTSFIFLFVSLHRSRVNKNWLLKWNVSCCDRTLITDLQILILINDSLIKTWEGLKRFLLFYQVKTKVTCDEHRQ